MLDSGGFVISSLLDEGVITPEQHGSAIELASSKRIAVDEALIELGAIGSRELAIARARVCEYPFVDIESYDIDIQNASLLPQTVASRTGAFPLFVLGDIATVAMEDPLDLQAIDQIHQLLRMQVDPVICDANQLRALIERAYSLAGGNGPEADGSGENELTSGDEPIVKAVNQILRAAADQGVSDIHINPDEGRLHLRFRVDGVLQPQQGPAASAHQAIVQRLKVMARLDLTQSRRPQDGKFRFIHNSTPIDVRLSIIPTVHGENVVMRLLRPASQIGSIRDLGMAPEVTADFERLITKPHGIILVTGPTGSGKTTTLYTALSHLNSPHRNIMSIEDPVEIRLPMIRQVQVNSEIGLTFASALRSILRQDPDVVLVGEIRDEETARIAVQAALTGHLVFSTLHTNDAVGSVARLRDMNIPSFAINNALIAVIAQRLVRRVCDVCREPHVATDEELSAAGVTSINRRSFVRGAGCGRCMNTGYRGRAGVFEMLRITPSVQRLIAADGTEPEIEDLACSEGMRTLLDDAIDKALLGITSLEEVAKLNATVSVLAPIPDPMGSPGEPAEAVSQGSHDTTQGPTDREAA